MERGGGGISLRGAREVLRKVEAGKKAGKPAPKPEYRNKMVPLEGKRDE